MLFIYFVSKFQKLQWIFLLAFKAFNGRADGFWATSRKSGVVGDYPEPP